jgi:tetratricopeptide (TPR) repeat protein
LKKAENTGCFTPKVNLKYMQFFQLLEIVALTLTVLKENITEAYYYAAMAYLNMNNYNGDIERLETALENYRTRSAARANYTISQGFVDEVRRLCDEYQRTHVFKREVTRELENEEGDIDNPPQKRISL